MFACTLCLVAKHPPRLLARGGVVPCRFFRSYPSRPSMLLTTPRPQVLHVTRLASTSASTINTTTRDTSRSSSEGDLLEKPLTLPDLALPFLPPSPPHRRRDPPSNDTTLHALLHRNSVDEALALFLATPHNAHDRAALAAVLVDHFQKLEACAPCEDTPLFKRREFEALVSDVAALLPLDQLDAWMAHTKSDTMTRFLFARYARAYACAPDEQKAEALQTALRKMPAHVSPRLASWMANMLLDKCLAAKRLDDVSQLLAHGIVLDATSYNMLIRSRLAHDPAAARALYDEMIRRGITPTTATFNTFLRHSIDTLAWDKVTDWMDEMQKRAISPNPITLRILMAGVCEHTDQPQLQTAYDHVVHHIDLANYDLERITNIAATHLLRAKQTKTALDTLSQLFRRLPPAELSLYAYNIFLHALVQYGDMHAARNLFDRLRAKDEDGENDAILSLDASVDAAAQLPRPDAITYTTLIHGYIRNSPPAHVDLHAVVELYQDMVDQQLETTPTLQAVLLFGMIKAGSALPMDHHQHQTQQTSHNPKSLDACVQLFELLVDQQDQQDQQDPTLAVTTPTAHKKRMQMRLYNMIMDGFFVHSQHDHNKKHWRPYRFLDQAIARGLPMQTDTLNIWIRGLALFHHDLPAAETMLDWMHRQHGVNWNERTLYYLVMAALNQDQRAKARQWITQFEANGNTIQGTGLLYFKSLLMP
ncbi:hypothetical protein BC940DRAFT_305352 [Gongronella butleri]|nr:hypothetical protein BC940DRAFT_305352 [Gongronella butleri]